MFELILGSFLSLTSLLIGFSLGKNQAVVTPDFKKQIHQIFTRVVPKSDVGAVERPSDLDNYYRDNPSVAREHDVMGQAIDTLSR